MKWVSMFRNSTIYRYFKIEVKIESIIRYKTVKKEKTAFKEELLLCIEVILKSSLVQNYSFRSYLQHPGKPSYVLSSAFTISVS